MASDDEMLSLSDDTESDVEEDPSERELLKRRTRPGGVVGNSTSQASDSRARRQAFRQIETLRVDYLAKKRVAAEAKFSAGREHDKLVDMQQEAAKLQEELLLLEAEHAQHRLGSIPAALTAALADARARSATVAERVRLQRELAEREMQVQLQSEKVSDTAELLVHKARLDERRLASEKAQEAAEERAAAKGRARNEDRAVKHLVRDAAARTSALEQLAAEEAEREEAKVQAALTANVQARKRVAGSRTVRREARAKAVEKLAQDKQHRTAVVLELKANTEVAMAELKGANERNANRQRQQARREQTEFDDIRAEGGNPYEVFRRRKLQSKARANRENQLQRIKRTEMEIAHRMVIEDERNRKREATERQHKLFADQYVKELGRQAAEDRVREYMLSRTKDGTDIVDATGRVHRIEPSQVTRIKDNSFGLGRSEAMPADTRLDLIDRVQGKSAKNQRVQADPRFVPKDKRAAAAALHPGGGGAAGKRGGVDQEDEGRMPGIEFAGLSEEAEAQKDAESAAAAAAVAESTAAAAAAAATAAAAAATETAQPTGSKLKKPKRSKYEERLWATAMEKHRQPTIKKQVVWGREFQGRPFLPKPESIVFTDFDVGRDMVQRITLTNVSFTFNHFKILDLSDDIKDFFDISYTKPGRMSAGMSCSVTIRFMPKLARDIHAELPLLAETGHFSIPLICTTKKVVPSVNTNDILFENVVMGETETFGLKVTNNGALPADFVVLRQSEEDAAAEPPATAATATTGSVLLPEQSIAGGGGGGGDDEFTLVEQVCSTEEQLLALAASVALTSTEYPEGLGPIQFQTTWRCEPYSSITVPVTFAPLSPGMFGEELVLRFDAPEVEDIRVSLVATSIKVPIFVHDPVMDVRCTVYDKLYRAPLVLHNRGNVALKFQTQVPRELRDVVSFHPDMGFAQAADRMSVDEDGNPTPGTFVVHVKFRPTRGLLERCGRYALVDQGVLAVPVQVLVPDQVLPVYFTLRAQITTSDIVFSVPSLDFGSCYTTQSICMPLTVHTDSALPQKIAFVSLPSELEVQPNDGFASLLPRDSRTFDVLFKPISAVDHARSLIVRSSLNREFTLPIRGQGIDPPLRLSHTRINFAATAFGDHERQSVFVTNVSKQEICFEFDVPAPEYSQVRVTPLVGRLEPGKAVRVQIEFSPNARALNATPAAAAAAAAQEGAEPELLAADPSVESVAQSDAPSRRSDDDSDNEDDDDGGGGGDADRGQGGDGDQGEGGESKSGSAAADADRLPVLDFAGSGVELPSGCSLFVSDIVGRPAVDTRECHVDGDDVAAQDAEPWSMHGQWLVPMFVQVVEKEKDKSGSSSPSRKARQALPPFFVQVNTTVVKRELVAETQRVSFGQVAVGEAEVYPLRVRNMSSVDSAILMSGLTSIGPFSVLNAVRPLAGKGGSQKLLIEFRPERQLKFCETMLLESNKGRVSVVVVGEGVSPTLSVEPADGRINVGHVVAREQCSATFTLRNFSVFPLTYAVKPTHRLPTNYNQREVFACVPPEAQIEAGGSQVVTVLFRPDHERPMPYQATFLVDVPNQAVEHRVTVTGRCWARQLYVHPTLLSDEPPAASAERVEDVFDLPAHLGLGGGGGDGEAAAAAVAPPVRRITLTFPKPSPGEDGQLPVYTKSVTVGCAQRSETGGGGSGSWELDLSDAHFSASKSKGSDSAGGSTEVTFTFTPPQPEQTAGLLVGKWVEALATVSLKGGYCPPGQTDAAVVEVVLRGYVTI